MECKICGCRKIDTIWNDRIRNGKFGQLTETPVKMYQCGDCGTIWHDVDATGYADYYESEQYRQETNGGVAAEFFYQSFDEEVLRKLTWIGTSEIRGKIVADVGCAVGSLVDFWSGPAKKIIAIEPSKIFRKELKEKGYVVYPYISDAVADGAEADLVTSFDVIEHIEDPVLFVKEIYDLCSSGGRVVIGTPAEYAIARRLAGHAFEQFQFRHQHPWIFTKDALELMAIKAGFTIEKTAYKQRYNFSNLLMWLSEGKPNGNGHLPFITQELEDEYIRSCEEKQVADYLLIYLRK